MNQVYSTIKIRKYKHLNLQERSQIQILLKQGNSITKISKMLRRSRTTIYNELKRGTVPQIKQNKKKVLIYYPDTGQKVYEMNRKNSKKKFKIGQCPDFVMYVNRCYRSKKWSLDQITGRAKLEGKYDTVLCTKTLYNYVDLGLLDITPTQLPLKLKRNNKRQKNRQNKKKLGKSIEQRPKEVETREEFGHWEADTVIGKKTKRYILHTPIFII